MDADLLIELINTFRGYYTETKSGGKKSLDGFRAWLNEQSYKKEDHPEHSIRKHNLAVADLEIEIMRLLVLLNRYARILLKKGNSQFPFFQNEDFTYLYTLINYESLTKIQLIEKNIHEKQTGLEIIKRLVGNGLIGEMNDPSDKRATRVFVTDQGQKAFLETAKTMSNISEIVSGRLTVNEKEQLLALLKKLEIFHQDIQLRHRLKSIDDLLQLT